MKVLQITTHFNTGGISRYILTLSEALISKTAEVSVASSGGDLEESLAKCRIPHRHLCINTKFEFGPKAIISGFKIAGMVRDDKIDILHAHTRVSQVAASVASIITGVPYVTTCHGYFKKRARGILDTWGNKVIAISGAVEKHLRNDLGVDGSRISLIYSGIDAAVFSRRYSRDEVADMKKSVGLRPGPVVGTIGRLSSVKGQKFLVAAMKDILAEMPDAQCLIIGDGPEKPALKALAGSLGLDSSIKFIESCVDTRKYLAMMDVFIFPSIKEGLGIALLEALASGRACIASKIGGIEDIITEGLNGLLVDVGDPSGIAEAAKRLLRDDLLRKNLGDEGAALVRDKFVSGVMADKILGLYEEVIKR
ncbi:MAG: glycosyltransferase family 4 protein [Candidatus Omnitrophica bacterium]|nr:glycosyltransferase family 4 protein [Candidatus Omnitrophota bacterium]MBU0881740.1 glycosyltransferase family 4 protein [Candidatus Omnitrophota bacterium]MBU1808627.1 glycosyltransferase family 4 protein [Candidatus Omnitrophota bacterium]